GRARSRFGREGRRRDRRQPAPGHRRGGLSRLRRPRRRRAVHPLAAVRPDPTPRRRRRRPSGVGGGAPGDGRAGGGAGGRSRPAGGSGRGAGRGGGAARAAVDSGQQRGPLRRRRLRGAGRRGARRAPRGQREGDGPPLGRIRAAIPGRGRGPHRQPLLGSGGGGDAERARLRDVEGRGGSVHRVAGGRGRRQGDHRQRGRPGRHRHGLDVGGGQGRDPGRDAVRPGRRARGRGAPDPLPGQRRRGVDHGADHPFEGRL
ncbi:MAG: hypothetical protein AVDCRST_MAG19-627, partial [uncultured Thermomicrobiales bacterium]